MILIIIRTLVFLPELSCSQWVPPAYYWYLFILLFQKRILWNLSSKPPRNDRTLPRGASRHVARRMGGGMQSTLLLLG